MTELTQYIPDEGTMLRFGKKLAEVLVKQPKDNAIVLYFNGDLGAGKTTLTRGMVRKNTHSEWLSGTCQSEQTHRTCG